MPALTRDDFDAIVDFVATGGYALKAYDRFARIRLGKDERWRIANPNVAQRYRLNVGTIVAADMLKVRLVRSRASKIIPRGGRLLGEVEEYFVETMVPGDTFVFSGEILKYEALVEDEVYVSRSTAEDPKVPAYEGGKFPLSTYLAARVRNIIAHPQEWRELPAQVREWLEIQQWRSQMPGARELLVESFPRGNKHYLICYPFEGRLAHQTLGMLLTRRLERARLRPLGFVANEYALAVWGLGDVAQHIARGELALDALFDEDMLGDDLEAWLAESSLMKRTFRTCAIIAGLIERRFPGRRSRDVRSQSPPTSCTTCCAAISLTMYCCVPPGPTPRPACSTCAALPICSRASRAESFIKRWTMCRPSPFPSCWRSGANRSTARRLIRFSPRRRTNW